MNNSRGRRLWRVGVSSKIGGTLVLFSFIFSFQGRWVIYPFSWNFIRRCSITPPCCCRVEMYDHVLLCFVVYVYVISARRDVIYLVVWISSVVHYLPTTKELKHPIKTLHWCVTPNHRNKRSFIFRLHFPSHFEHWGINYLISLDVSVFLNFLYPLGMLIRLHFFLYCVVYCMYAWVRWAFVFLFR